MSYCFGRKQPLAFEMVKIKDALPLGFVLTGRAYEGVLGETGFMGCTAYLNTLAPKHALKSPKPTFIPTSP
ncbi:hypothetical protein [Moraxella bovis]|uniref:hypothetical protein n=1 Tax=Moraxella bovis TaxID=476 RepID=UPI0011C05FBE|nr:hypothetical protein [Moraxella bovis]